MDQTETSNHDFPLEKGAAPLNLDLLRKKSLRASILSFDDICD
jgi:hypothetical protein